MRLRLVALIATLALTGAAQTFRVAGTVVDSESGKPLNRTRVVLTDGPVGELSVVTAPDGRFSFDVPQGKYTLLAAHRDWGEPYGQILPSNDSGAAIITGPDRDTSHLEFRFRAPVAIHGKVVDQNGDPIPSATVELFLQSVVAGRKRLRSLGTGESDDFGEYSWSSLNAGTYYLSVTGEPWCLFDEVARIQLLEADAMALAQPYALSYYPGTDDANAAVPLVLRPGAEVQADFTLHPASSAILRFSCPNVDLCGGWVDLYAMGPGEAQALVSTTYLRRDPVIHSVRPGRYTIRYTSEEGNTRKVIDVSNGEVSIYLEPKPAPTLLGKVSFQNLGERPRHKIYVNLLDEDTGKPDTLILGPDGVFSWPMVTASRGRLFLSGEDGFFIAQMKVDGANVKDGVIDFPDGAAARVELLASNETGTLKGLVKNENDEPASSVLVVLVPVTASSDARQPLAFQTDSDGSFDCPNVPIGDYALFAVQNPELEYANPESIHPYLPAAKRVRIEPHTTRTEDIGLSPAAHN
jgi:hypothetical protein